MRYGKSGFVMVIVISVMAILALVASVIINVGCGEAIQVRTQNDYVSAGYMAAAGAERMYAIIADRWQSSATEEWTTLNLAQTNMVVDGVTVGNYRANAYRTNNPREFNIVSIGMVNNRSVTVTAKYGYMVDYSNGVPLSAVGNMSLTGHKVLFWKFPVSVDGPVNGAGTIEPLGNGDTRFPNNNYVQYTGTVTEGAPVTAPSFWLYSRFDTKGLGVPITHSDPNYIIVGDCTTQDQIDAFNENNVYTTTTQDAARLDDKDGYYYYYTTYLDNDPTGPYYDAAKPHLEIGPGEANYVASDVTYSPFSVPSGEEIIFVDGDVNVILNAQSFWTGTSDLTLVSMNDILIIQPVNGSDDRLTLVAYNSIDTGGLSLGEDALIEGNLVMYSGGGFNAYLGGKSYGPIFAGGNVLIDTNWSFLYSARDFNMGRDNWADAANWPLGLPSGFPVFNRGYHVRTEEPGTDLSANYNPRWQKRKNN
ncbi:MAG: hypothetical protein V1682_07715 [Candidatus Omnitrophota bacterium]